MTDTEQNQTNETTATAQTPEPAAAPAPEPQPQPQPQPPAAPAAKGYAIIETGGKQYRVSVGDRLSVERLTTPEGDQITFDRVLLVGGDGTTRVGVPVVDGATVSATVDDHFRGEKIVVFKYKPKKRYRRRIGHRQSLTHLTITAINA
jgi:large subunit ribosomal protein L21